MSKVIDRVGELSSCSYLESWVVVPIILKKNYCFLFFSILNLSSVFICRVLFDTRQKSVRKKYLAKNRLPIKYLPSVTLDKGFAEYKIAFAECLKHSTKNAIPVVLVRWFFVMKWFKLLIILDVWGKGRNDVSYTLFSHTIYSTILCPTQHMHLHFW